MSYVSPSHNSSYYAAEPMDASPSPTSAASTSMLRLRPSKEVHTEDESSTTTQSSSKLRTVAKTFREFDVLYPKAEEDLFVRTQFGGTISMITLFFLFVLTFYEFVSYMTVATNHSIAVDTRGNNRVSIRLNITFPALTCDETLIDLMDVSGEIQADAHTNVWRQRLSPRGEPIGEAYTEEDLHHGNHDSHEDSHKPLSSSIMPSHPNTMYGREGCNVAAILSVNRVAGNVHVALGSRHQTGDPVTDARHVHSYQLMDSFKYNSSHIIHSFEFGESFPYKKMPLQKHRAIIPAGHPPAHFQYFIKVVPTIYNSIYSQRIEAAQYSVTEQVHYISLSDAFRGDSRRIPGVFFLYDFSPFMMIITEKGTSFSSFIVSICAIVGGVFTVVGTLDSLIFWMNRRFRVPK